VSRGLSVTDRWLSLPLAEPVGSTLRDRLRRLGRLGRLERGRAAQVGGGAEGPGRSRGARRAGARGAG
jgi:hypothetical protein